MKTKPYIFTLRILVLMMPLCLFAQANDTSTTVNVPIRDSFSRISAKGTFSLTIEQGDNQSISFNNEIGGNVKYSVEDGTLTLKSETGKVRLLAKNITEIYSSDAVTIRSQGTISTPDITITLKDASTQNIAIACENATISAHDATKLKITGTSRNLSITIHDATIVEAGLLETQNIVANTNDASSAWINATESISGTTKDVSTLHYFENVKKVNIESHDFSKAKKFNEIKIEKDDQTEILGSDSISNMVTDILVEIDSSFNEINPTEMKSKWYRDFFSKKGYDGNWGGLMIGFNNLLSPSGKMEVPIGYEFLKLDFTGSRTVALNLFEQNFPLIKNRLGITTGLGFQWYNYRFEKNAQLFANQSMINGQLDTANASKYTKSKLAYTTLNIPVMMEFQTNNSHNLKSFHLNAGIILGIKLGAHTKTIINDGARMKIEVKDDFNLNPIRLDASAGIGYGKINLFASYSLTQLFKEKEGPRLHPVTAGIYLLLW